MVINIGLSRVPSLYDSTQRDACAIGSDGDGCATGGDGEKCDRKYM